MAPVRDVRSKQLTASNVISEIKELLNADRILTVRIISGTPDLVQGVFIIFCTKSSNMFRVSLSVTSPMLP